VDEFEEWYREVYPRVVTTLTIVLGSTEDAADATSEAFVRAYQRWDRVRRMARPDGWVYRVALHVGRRHGRRRQAEQRRERAVALPDRTVDATRALDEFQALVDGLGDRMKEVLALRHVADLTEPTIAEVLRISRSTVSSTLRDAYQRIERSLDAEERR
jgi:RNA polymerase sigma-70 factor (ECF subfamily)